MSNTIAAPRLSVSVKHLAPMTGEDILNEIGLKAYKKPLSAIRSQPGWPCLKHPLHVAILIIDFDSEVNMNGLLGFLENSTGAYLDQTIEAFRVVGAQPTANTLSAVRELMGRQGVSHQRLREPHRHTTEYQITTFAELHGSALDDFAEGVGRLEDLLYVHDQAQESPFPKMEAYVEGHAAEIQAEMRRIGA